jgi:hypothetical protein
MKKGEIFFCAEFPYSDGGTGQKYFVVLNSAPTDKPFLVILTTTQKKDRRDNEGCYAAEGYFFIKPGTEWFPEPTWLKFNHVYEFPYAEAIEKERQSVFKNRGCLTPERCNSVVSCIKYSYDITKEQISLL